MDLPALDIPTEIQASASNVYGKGARDYGPQQAFDGDPETRWATDPGTKRAWIAGRLRKPGRFAGVRIQEAYPGRVRKFEFQFRDGAVWKTACAGTTLLGAHTELKFPAVTAQEFRLNILDATDGPTIAEIQLIPANAP